MSHYVTQIDANIKVITISGELILEVQDGGYSAPLISIDEESLQEILEKEMEWGWSKYGHEAVLGRCEIEITIRSMP